MTAAISGTTAEADLVDNLDGTWTYSVDLVDYDYEYQPGVGPNLFYESHQWASGMQLLTVGYTDLVVNSDEGSYVDHFQIVWWADISTTPTTDGVYLYGGHIAANQNLESYGPASHEWDVSSWGLQTFVPGDGALGLGFDAAYNTSGVVSGFLYMTFGTEAIPAPGALALLGLAGIATRRRRR